MTIKPYSRFMILSSPRSGTHMLRTSLNSNPAIVTKTEIFNPDFFKDKPFDDSTDDGEILSRHVFADYPESIRSVGFILHRSGAKFGNWPNLWDRLAADKSLKIISLTRLNLLRRHVSHQVMRDRNRNLPEEVKYFTADELKKEFLHQEQMVKKLNTRFSGHPIFHITYEDLYNDYGSIMQNLQLFLDVNTAKLKPSTKRNPENVLKKIIGNFDELADAFKDTRWGWFFRLSKGFRAVHQGSIDPGDLVKTRKPQGFHAVHQELIDPGDLVKKNRKPVILEKKKECPEKSNIPEKITIKDNGLNNVIEGLHAVRDGFLDVTITGNNNRIKINKGFINNSEKPWIINGDNNTITLGENTVLRENTFFKIKGNNNTAAIGSNVNARFGVRIEADAADISVGGYTTSIHCVLRVHESTSLILGEDCMISAGVLISTSDMHPICDMATDERVNPAGDIIIGDHVWLGQRSRIYNGVTIGTGAIVGAGAIVTNDVESHTSVAGVPAGVIRKNIYWSRKKEKKVLNPDAKVHYAVNNESVIVVCSMAAGSGYIEKVSACLDSHKNYCIENGYNYRLETDILDSERPLPWGKILFLKRLLDNSRHEVIVWIDADAMITNNKIKIENLMELMGDKDLLLTNDCNGNINTGVMILRNTMWGKMFLEKVYQNTEFINHPHWEQGAIIDMVNSDPEIRNNTYLTDAAMSYAINAFIYNFSPGSWLLHFAGHNKLKPLIDFYKAHANQSINFNLKKTGNYFRLMPKSHSAPLLNRESNDYLTENLKAVKKSGCNCFGCRNFMNQMQTDQKK